MWKHFFITIQTLQLKLIIKKKDNILIEKNPGKIFFTFYILIISIVAAFHSVSRSLLKMYKFQLEIKILKKKIFFLSLRILKKVYNLYITIFI